MAEEAPLFYDFCCYRIDVQAGRLLRDGREVVVAAKPFDVLKLLVSKCGREVKRRDFYKTVWHDADAVWAAGSLNDYIFRLRRIFGDTPRTQKYIQTTRDGYRFIPQVAPVNAGVPDDVQPDSEEIKRVLLLSRDDVPLTENQAKLIVYDRDYYCPAWNEAGKGIKHKYEVQRREDVLVVVDHATDLM